MLFPVEHHPHEPGRGPAGHEGPEAIPKRLRAGVQLDRVPEHGSEDPPLGRPLQLPHGLEDLTRDLPRIRGTQRLPVLRTPGLAGAGIEDPQLIVDLRRGGHRGARVPAHRGGFYGHGGPEALDAIHRRLVLGSKELARVGGE